MPLLFFFWHGSCMMPYKMQISETKLLVKSDPNRLTRLSWMVRRQWFFVRQRWFSALSFLLLDNAVSGRARAALLRLNGATVGKNCFIRGGLQIQEGFDLTIGNNVFINAGCCIDTSSPVTLGNNVELGYNVTLATGDHHIGPHEHRTGNYNPRPIFIADGVWIGAGAMILPGVKLGAGAVIMAGSVVGQDVPSDMLVGGVPARPIRKLE